MVDQNLDMFGIPGTRWDGEICDRCGHRNVVGFYLPDELWQAVVDDPDAICCLTCFDELDELAELKNVQYSMFDIEFCHVAWSEWSELRNRREEMSRLAIDPWFRLAALAIVPSAVIILFAAGQVLYRL